MPRSDWLRATLDLMADETSRVRPGSDAVVSRLCDILVIQAIRAWIERDPRARTGWLGALRDDHLGAAIAAVHHDPRRRWTVGALAAEAAMSRSAFAARFTELVGEPAMQYVSRWRMYHAAELLADGGVSVHEAAAAWATTRRRRSAGRSPGCSARHPAPSGPPPGPTPPSWASVCRSPSCPRTAGGSVNGWDAGGVASVRMQGSRSRRPRRGW